MTARVPHQTPDTVLQQAIAHHRAGRLAEAERLYRVVLQVNPNQPDANHNLGLLAWQSGHAELGLPYLKAALEAKPAQRQYWLSYAEMLFAVGQPQKAIGILEQGQQRGLSGAAIDGLMARMRAGLRPELGRGEDSSHLYTTAMRLHQAGELGEAIALYRQILVGKPNFAEVHVHLGNALKAHGALAEAVHCYRNALSLQPDLIEIYVNLGNALTAQGRIEEAVASYRRALAARPDFAEAHYNLGNALKVLGALGEAVASYQRAVALKPDLAVAYFNLGNTLRAKGALEEALAAYANALAARPDFAEAHNNLGSVLYHQGKTDEAMASYRQALAIRPDFAEAHNNLGTVLNDQKKLDEAATCFRQALAIRPDYAEAHNNLGIVLNDEHKFNEAVESYRRAIAFQPDYVEAYNHLGVALCESHQIAEGFEWFTRGAKLVYGEPGGRARKAAVVRPHKAQHDQEQRAYLAGDDALDDAAVSEQFHLEHGARLAGSAINLRNNIGEIEEQWRTNKPQIVVIDNLLNPTALEELRRFCWGSTIWREVYDKGYLGTRPQSGFACPLLAQVAEELRLSYPGIFHNHPLLYSWSFKYDNKLQGVQIHADFAAVNVNFWITPDEANLDPNSGGLVVWDVAAPLDWDFIKYNTDESAIRDFLAREKAKSVSIPYRANRAVIFDSDLFHATDQMAFKDGYTNRRINITLLYGWRGEKV
jgi:tetratricopeptide (TPR) repeat protein